MKQPVSATCRWASLGNGKMTTRVTHYLYTVYTNTVNLLSLVLRFSFTTSAKQASLYTYNVDREPGPMECSGHFFSKHLGPQTHMISKFLLEYMYMYSGAQPQVYKRVRATHKCKRAIYKCSLVTRVYSMPYTRA